MKYSIIVIVNKKQIFLENLQKSLQKQSYKDYELIVIDNTENRYKNANEALEEGVKKAKGARIIFTHQDIIFLNKESFEKIDLEIDKIGKLEKTGIIGVAGVSSGADAKIYSSIFHGSNKHQCGDIIIDCAIEVETVDECFFVISAELLKKYGFNKYLKGFHLYAVEYCFRMKRLGMKNYVIPAELWHLSSGASLDWTYYRELIKVRKEHRELSYINTTVLCWKNTILLKWKLIFFMVRNLVHHNLRRK